MKKKYEIALEWNNAGNWQDGYVWNGHTFADNGKIIHYNSLAMAKKEFISAVALLKKGEFGAEWKVTILKDDDGYVSEVSSKQN